MSVGSSQPARLSSGYGDLAREVRRLGLLRRQRPYYAGVFLGADFVTITKDGDRDWYLLKPSILGVIMEHFTAGRPVINETATDDNAAHEDDDEIVDERPVLRR